MSLLGLGSVSTAVLASADVPVAVIRKDMQLPAAPAVRCSNIYCVFPASALLLALKFTTQPSNFR